MTLTASQYLFARLYGYMLGRRYRNTPEQACLDAITPYIIMVGVPATLVVVVAAAALFPQLFSSKGWIPWVVVPSGVAMYVLSRGLLRYARTPEIAEAFTSPASRRLTMATYLVVLLGSIFAAGTLAHVLVH